MWRPPWHHALVMRRCSTETHAVTPPMLLENRAFFPVTSHPASWQSSCHHLDGLNQTRSLPCIAVCLISFLHANQSGPELVGSRWPLMPAPCPPCTLSGEGLLHSSHPSSHLPLPSSLLPPPSSLLPPSSYPIPSLSFPPPSPHPPHACPPSCLQVRQLFLPSVKSLVAMWTKRFGFQLPREEEMRTLQGGGGRGGRSRVCSLALVAGWYFSNRKNAQCVGVDEVFRYCGRRERPSFCISTRDASASGPRVKPIRNRPSLGRRSTHSAGRALLPPFSLSVRSLNDHFLRANLLGHQLTHLLTFAPSSHRPIPVSPFLSLPLSPSLPHSLHLSLPFRSHHLARPRQHHNAEEGGARGRGRGRGRVRRPWRLFPRRTACTTGSERGGE